MQRFAGIVVSLAAAAVAFGSFFVVGAARAEDAPGGAGGMPPSEKKIEHPFVKAWLGEWDVTMTMMGKESPAKSKVAMGVGGTAVIEDYTADMMGTPFAGHGVMKLADDGKTVSMWWFDSMESDATKFTGTLADKALEVTSTGRAGAMKIVMKQVDGGFDWEATMDGKPWMTQKYRKAK